MKEKIVIRKKALANRKKKYFEISSKFFNPLIKLLKINKSNSKNILSLYYPSNYEVNTLSFLKLIETNKIKTLLPVIKIDTQINFVEWKYLDPLRVNKFGMLEPSIQGKTFIPNFMLVPLLAFDNNNNRLGYGKGFYDRFLNKFLKVKKNITTIGVAFSFQKYNKLPVSSLDVKLDYILTEKGLKK
ncbi:5-formyltetrahydrofolate cyclo-ligase [Pelagibacteraceae bacterium]|nr:5-formyltetrahydrofolate cyclo-ligase [Pelagibacteraceae bacterium]